MSTTARNDEFDRRRKSAQQSLIALGAQALVTDRPENIRYLSGYPAGGVASGRPLIAVLLVSGELVIIAGTQLGEHIAHYLPTTRIENFGAPVLVPSELSYPDGPLQFAPAAFETLRTVLHDAAVTCAAVDGLNAVFPPLTGVSTALTDIDLVGGSSLLWQLRRKKSPWEVEQLRTAAQDNGNAFDTIVSHLHPGMTEADADRRMAITILESGANFFFAQSVVTENGREILGPGTDRVWHEGELLNIDAGTSVEGYSSDFCRTYVAGTPSSRQVDSYQRVVDARDAALSAFRPGFTAGQLANEMFTVLGTRPELVAGRMGHGLGIGLEPPSLSPADPTVLEDGLVFCLEPAVVIDGSYYTLEELYLVSDGQLVLLSPPAPRELIVI